jgi:hypothetical protein
MIFTPRVAPIAMGLLLSLGALTGARASVPSAYALQPGTVLSTHTPPTSTCPIAVWRLWIGPSATVRGSIQELGTDKAWNLSGTFDSHGAFHLNGKEVDNTVRAATVDAQVQTDGSMIFRMANAGDPSECYNRTVYLPWFRNGTDFGPPPVGGGGGGG